MNFKTTGSVGEHSHPIVRNQITEEGLEERRKVITAKAQLTGCFSANLTTVCFAPFSPAGTSTHKTKHSIPVNTTATVLCRAQRTSYTAGHEHTVLGKPVSKHLDVLGLRSSHRWQHD